MKEALVATVEKLDQLIHTKMPSSHFFTIENFFEIFEKMIIPIGIQIE